MSPTHHAYWKRSQRMWTASNFMRQKVPKETPSETVLKNSATFMTMGGGAILKVVPKWCPMCSWVMDHRFEWLSYQNKNFSLEVKITTKINGLPTKLQTFWNHISKLKYGSGKINTCYGNGSGQAEVFNRFGSIYFLSAVSNLEVVLLKSVDTAVILKSFLFLCCQLEEFLSQIRELSFLQEWGDNGPWYLKIPILKFHIFWNLWNCTLLHCKKQNIVSSRYIYVRLFK